MSQTISKQIVSKIFEMGSLKQTISSSKHYGNAAVTIFDLDTTGVTTCIRETSHAVQRKLITKNCPCF